MEHWAKRTKKDCIESSLMWYALTRGVDLWVFKEVFTDMRYNYDKYEEMWKEVSRTKLTPLEYDELQHLLRNYMGVNR